jgi:hypothetical protein
MKSKKLLAMCSLLALSYSSTLAYNLPGFNVGGTSFYDSAPAPAGPGWYLIEYLQYMSANELKDKDGKSLGLPKEETDVFVPLTQVIYSSEKKWGNTSAGLTVLPTMDGKI